MRRNALVIVSAVSVLLLSSTGPAAAQTTWTQVGADINGVANSLAGWATAMSADGSMVASGAPYESFPGKSSAGGVRIYEWNGSAWTQRGSTLEGAAGGDLFGWSVGMTADGNTIAVGATQLNTGNGTAAVYTWDSGTSDWQAKGSAITISGSGSRLGSAIDLSDDGNTIVIGAPTAGGGTNAGQATVFEWNGSSWATKGVAFTGSAGDFLGVDVSISADGDTVAFGALGTNIGGNASAGKVEVYGWIASTWTQVGATIGGTAAGQSLGNAVDLTGDASILAIGARNANLVRVFELTGSTWVQRGSTLTGVDPGYFGYSVALSSDGNDLVAGAANANGLAGQAVTYEWSGGDWSQRGAVIDGLAASDRAGFSVAMSSNGNVISVGSERSDEGGTDSGQIRVYSWPTTEAAVLGPATYFTFVLPDGRECSAISPMQVQVGAIVELPGVDALCQTMPGSSVAGWTIPVPHGFTGYGSSLQPFPPGLRVRVVESQRFTLVPFEPNIQIDYDANIAARDSCVPANLAHTSDDGRTAHVWVPRVDFAVARTPAQAPCVPEGHQLTGWNTAGDGTGETIEPGAPLPDSWAEGSANHHRLYAVWRAA